MKKIIFAMVLITSISRQTIAQTVSASTNNPFEIPSGSLSIRYSIDLGKGNTLQVEMTDKEDIDKFKNIDSILAVFFKDILPFKDSLSDELAAKRIDYVTDAAGRKKIRIRSYKPLASSFVIQQGEVAALKYEQDTVNIIGSIAAPVKFAMRKALTDIRYYRLSFFINDFNDLKDINGKPINEKIISFNNNKRWIKDDGVWYIKNGDKSISSKTPFGNISGTGDYFASKLSTSIQNYRNKFVPSISAGVDFVISDGTHKNSLGFEFESHFFFAKDIGQNVKIFQNSFFTFSYTQSSKEEQSSGILSYNPNFSLSYLIKRRGEFYDKNTFRFGSGKVYLFKEAVSLEPSFYFNNLFKNMTPSLSLSVGF